METRLTGCVRTKRSGVGLELSVWGRERTGHKGREVASCGPGRTLQLPRESFDQKACLERRPNIRFCTDIWGKASPAGLSTSLLQKRPPRQTALLSNGHSAAPRLLSNHSNKQSHPPAGTGGHHTLLTLQNLPPSTPHAPWVLSTTPCGHMACRGLHPRPSTHD